MSVENPFENKIYDLYTELIFSSISDEEWIELQTEATKELEEIRRKRNDSN